MQAFTSLSSFAFFFLSPITFVYREEPLNNSNNKYCLQGYAYIVLPTKMTKVSNRNTTTRAKLALDSDTSEAKAVLLLSEPVLSIPSQTCCLHPSSARLCLSVCLSVCRPPLFLPPLSLSLCFFFFFFLLFFFYMICLFSVIHFNCAG